jgi:hypothetical protein
MAGTFKPEVALFDCTAQMSACQTQGAQTIFVVNKDRRNLRDDGAAVEAIVTCRTNIELAGRRGVKLIAQIADQSTNAKQARESQKGIGGQP